MASVTASETSSGVCCRCQKQTARQCGGCSGAPSHDEGPAPRTFYCGADCQRADWNRHKAGCKVLQARKSLQRAAQLLQAITYRIRRNAFPFAVSSVKRECNTIILKSPDEDKTHPQSLQSFPSHLEQDPELLKSICLHKAGIEAILYLDRFVREMLHGISTAIEEVEVVLANRKLCISSISQKGLTEESMNHPHQVYKVTLMNGESWAVDVTGIQHGHPDPLSPWPIYEQGRCARINGRWSLGHFRSQFGVDHGSLHRDSPINRAQVKALSRDLDRQIPELTATHGGSLSSLLKRPEVAFQSTTRRFLDDLEARVKDSLAKPAAPDETPGWEDEDYQHSPRALLESSSAPAEKAYCIKSAPGKGQGMFATRSIAKGTRLLAEAPIFRVPRDIPIIQDVERVVDSGVKQLNKAQRDAFFALHNNFDDRHSRALGIARTNALPLGSDAREGGIFLETSRINHSCRHNAQNTWNENLGKITIHAFKDIKEGDEITITYLHAFENYADAQAYLKKGFGFACTCARCSLPVAQRRLSDERLDKLTRLDALIGDGISIVSTPLACLRSAHEMKRLMDEEGIEDASIPRLYYDAFQIAIANGDQARARVFAERIYAARVILEGSDSPVAMKTREYIKNPDAHNLYETSMKWKQNVSRVPKGLSEEAFERWLWKLLGSSTR